MYLRLFYWSGRRDSNSRPPAPKAGALTGLRYAPCSVYYENLYKNQKKNANCKKFRDMTILCC